MSDQIIPDTNSFKVAAIAVALEMTQTSQFSEQDSLEIKLQKFINAYDIITALDQHGKSEAQGRLDKIKTTR